MERCTYYQVVITIHSGDARVMYTLVCALFDFLLHIFSKKNLRLSELYDVRYDLSWI